MDNPTREVTNTGNPSKGGGVPIMAQGKVKLEDGWMPVYCSEIQVSDRLPDYLDFSFFDVENRKHLYAKSSRQFVDSRSPILIRRTKDQLHYEISTLNVREAKPTEIRLLAFTTIVEAETYEAILKQENTKPLEKPQSTVKRVTRPVVPAPTGRRILHVTKRDIPVKLNEQPRASQPQKPKKPKQSKQKNGVEKTPSKESLEAALKWSDRTAKREERERASRQKVRVKTALEIAFEEANGNSKNQ